MSREEPHRFPENSSQPEARREQSIVDNVVVVEDELEAQRRDEGAIESAPEDESLEEVDAPVARVRREIDLFVPVETNGRATNEADAEEEAPLAPIDEPESSDHTTPEDAPRDVRLEPVVRAPSPPTTAAADRNVDEVVDRPAAIVERSRPPESASVLRVVAAPQPSLESLEEAAPAAGDMQVEVRIGRVEVKAPSPPEAVPRDTTEPFEDFALARSHLDRTWY